MRFLALFVLAGCISHAPFSKRDWAFQSVLATAAAIDYGQTRHIIKDKNEENPFVGDHGQRMDPLLFGIIAMGIEVFVARALPPDYREPFEVFFLGFESYVVYSNALQGYHPW